MVKERLDEGARQMKEALTFGRKIIQVDYDPDMVLADELAVTDPERFTASARTQWLRECLQRDNPHEVFPAVERAMGLRDQGQFDVGVAKLRTFTEAHPDYADGFDALGTLLPRGGRAAEAADVAPLFEARPELHRRLQAAG